MQSTLSKISRILNKSLEDVVKLHVLDDRANLSRPAVVQAEAVSSYDPLMTSMGLQLKYDSCMMTAQANADGGFDIEFCDFRVAIDGSFGSGVINDDIQGKWEYFQTNYLSLRDPFDIDNDKKSLGLDVEYPNIMFSGKDAKSNCKAGSNCGPVITGGVSEGYGGRTHSRGHSSYRRHSDWGQRTHYHGGGGSGGTGNLNSLLPAYGMLACRHAPFMEKRSDPPTW